MTKLNKFQKKDLYRVIGEELARLYKFKTISHYPEYDTSLVREETDIGELIRTQYVEPYLIEAESGDSSKISELQAVLATIKNVTKELERVMTDSENEHKDAFSLTVDKALIGDKGSS